MRFSFIVCLSDDSVLDANLMASPCLGSGTPHEVVAIRNAPSAAAGLNLGVGRAKHGWIVCVHQDVFLPSGWDHQLKEQLREAERRFGPIGVAGVYGVGDVVEGPGRPLAAQRIGRVVDRGRMLDEAPELPAPVATLDELLLVVRRDTPLRFDPALGFHLYGADLCLQARERGLAVVALNALYHHNSQSAGLPEPFFDSARVFARKWAHQLPIATPCVVFDREGGMHLLGNTSAEGPYTACAEGPPLLEGWDLVPRPRPGTLVPRTRQASVLQKG
jgi:hypothetical protein